MSKKGFKEKKSGERFWQDISVRAEFANRLTLDDWQTK
jgi:hypothetical protein